MQLIPEVFKRMPLSHKVAYLGVMAALSVVVNMFSINLFGGLIKLSFVGVICVFAGWLFGPLLGFAIAFLGDLINFLISSEPGAYSPLIGISNGMYAAIAGFVFIIFKNNKLIINVIISFVLAYFICTLLISAMGVYILFPIKSTFRAFMIKRITFQTPVNVANCILGYLLLRTASQLNLLRPADGA